MTGWRLTLKQAPRLRVDARALQPAALAGLSADDVARLRLPHGRDGVDLGELFTIAPIDVGGADGAQLELDGDLSRFDRIGWCLDGGRLAVHGPVGHHAGGGMSAGHLMVDGDAGELAACSMRGGRFDVCGNVGAFAAAPLPGDMDGMRGGTLVIGGHAGDRLADRMRRGTVVVFGDVGEFAASRMVAGTLALGGRCGGHLAYGMRRGSVLLCGGAPDLPPSFVPVSSNADVFWQLLARDLQKHQGPFAGLSQRRVRRHAGDLAVQGHGELLVPV